MNRYVIGSLWDRGNRNGANKNFEYLFEGRQKIDELNVKAEGVLNEAKITNDMNKNVQQQINTLIAESGTSDAEVVQARIDSEGNEYDVLKTRLDEKEQNFSAQLAQTKEELNETKKSIKPLIIDNWQLTGDLVHVGGYEKEGWDEGDTNWGAHFGDTGRTLIVPRRAIRQTGKIRAVLISVQRLSSSNSDWKFKVFRFNKNTNMYDFIDERTITPTVTGEQLFRFDDPIEVLAGDVPGVFGPDREALIHTTPHTATDTYVADGDISSSNAFTDTRTYIPDFEVYSNRPFLAVAGSSTLAGHNAGDYWWSAVEFNAPTKTLPGGHIESEVMYQMQQVERTLEYQNFGRGSSTYEFVSGEGIDFALSVNPHTVAVYSGTNDIALGGRFRDVESHLNVIKSKFDNSNSKRLIICEILPWTNSSDSQAAQLRDWNNQLADWCEQNGADLLKWNNEMAQVRPSTGELDDQKDEYNQDGVHWTQAGVNKLAELLLNKL